MNRRELLKTTTVAAAALGLGTGVLRAQTPKTLRFAHDSPTSTAWHIGALRMAEIVQERTSGDVEIQVYPAAQLGDTRELGEMAQLGSIDITLMTAGVAASFVPAMNLFGLPFLFENIDQARELYEGPAGAELMTAAEASGFKGLGFNILAFRSPMNSVRPIISAEDFDGLKIRLQQVPIHIDTYRALGSAPTALPYSEVYTAAQSGVIDGVENTPSGVYSPKFHEVMKFYSQLPVFINTSMIFMNHGVWNNLTDEEKVIVDEAAVEANQVINEEIFRLDEEAVEAMEAAGVDIQRGPFELDSFRELVQPVYDQYVPELPGTARRIVESLRA